MGLFHNGSSFILHAMDRKESQILAVKMGEDPGEKTQQSVPPRTMTLRNFLLLQPAIHQNDCLAIPTKDSRSWLQYLLRCNYLSRFQEGSLFCYLSFMIDQKRYCFSASPVFLAVRIAVETYFQYLSMSKLRINMPQFLPYLSPIISVFKMSLKTSLTLAQKLYLACIIAAASLPLMLCLFRGLFKSHQGTDTANIFWWPFPLGLDQSISSFSCHLVL